MGDLERKTLVLIPICE